MVYKFFDGKRYESSKRFKKRSQADSYAKKLRDAGKLARVIQVGLLRWKSWLVYVRNR